MSLATQAPQLVVKSDLALSFSKMHGLGNDFVMVESSELARLIEAGGWKKIDKQGLTEFCARLARLTCNRHFGIGGDGMIVAIKMSDLLADASPFGRALTDLVANYPRYSDCQVAWIYINSDGSYSAMCGNGMRCLAELVAHLGWLESNTFKVATAAYPVSVTVQSNDTARGGSAAAVVHTRLAGAVFDQDQAPLTVRGEQIEATRVSMGNPHCVIFSQDKLDIAAALDAYAVDIEIAHGQGLSLDKFPSTLLSLAEDIQSLSVFPEGVNVEFVHLESPEKAIVFVVERGCGATLACASGAAAVLAAGVKTNRLNKKSYVILPGGTLETRFDPEEIELIGPAVQVFSGAFPLPLDGLFGIASNGEVGTK